MSIKLVRHYIDENDRKTYCYKKNETHIIYIEKTVNNVKFGTFGRLTTPSKLRQIIAELKKELNQQIKKHFEDETTN